MAESAPVTATDGRLLAGAMASATAEILEKALAAVTGPEADAVRALRPRGELLLRLLGEIGEALKLALTAPPVEGRANQACVEFVAELLKVSRSSVTIVAGQTSRNKVIRVQGLSAAEVQARLRAAGA